MYDSKISDYSIVRHTPFGRDPLKELAEACREEGLVLGIYYSHAMDWHDPDSQGNTWDYPGNIGAYDEVESWIHDEDKRSRFDRYLRRKSLPQVRELLTEYGKVGLMWFDCGGKLTREQGEAFLTTVHALQQDCLVNSRVWKSPLGDYANTSDNQLETRAFRRDWENIITLNDSWGYKNRMPTGSGRMRSFARSSTWSAKTATSSSTSGRRPRANGIPSPNRSCWRSASGCRRTGKAFTARERRRPPNRLGEDAR